MEGLQNLYAAYIISQMKKRATKWLGKGAHLCADIYTSADVRLVTPLLDDLDSILWMSRNNRCKIWVRAPVKYVLDIFLHRHKEHLENAWKIPDENWFLGDQSNLYVGFLKLHISRLITIITYLLVSLYRLLSSKITKTVQSRLNTSNRKHLRVTQSSE